MLHRDVLRLRHVQPLVALHEVRQHERRPRRQREERRVLRRQLHGLDAVLEDVRRQPDRRRLRRRLRQHAEQNAPRRGRAAQGGGVLEAAQGEGAGVPRGVVDAEEADRLVQALPVHLLLRVVARVRLDELRQVRRRGLVDAGHEERHACHRAARRVRQRRVVEALCDVGSQQDHAVRAERGRLLDDLTDVPRGQTREVEPDVHAGLAAGPRVETHGARVEGCLRVRRAHQHHAVRVHRRALASGRADAERVGGVRPRHLARRAAVVPAVDERGRAEHGVAELWGQAVALGRVVDADVAGAAAAVDEGRRQGLDLRRGALGARQVEVAGGQVGVLRRHHGLDAPDTEQHPRLRAVGRVRRVDVGSHRRPAALRRRCRQRRCCCCGGRRQHVGGSSPRGAEVACAGGQTSGGCRARPRAGGERVHLFSFAKLCCSSPSLFKVFFFHKKSGVLCLTPSPNEVQIL
eukprot:Rhum_TRINITY_DN2130_c0_g1::Rhum_TRINITY_DN2130_c0_g1_i1::g.6089::m.6089